ncbi:metallophosphoesterase [Candidatus Harpocratesius sp.]
MKIGILSDTHDYLPNISKAVDVFLNEKVCKIIHCGDYIAPFVIRAMTKLIEHKIPVYGVFGNNDGERIGLKKITGKIIEFKGEFFEFTENYYKFAVYHGTDERILQNLIHSQFYDVLLTGHTHQIKIEKVGKTLLINPGETCGYLTGKATCAVLDLSSKHLSLDNVQIFDL